MRGFSDNGLEHSPNLVSRRRQLASSHCSFAVVPTSLNIQQCSRSDRKYHDCLEEGHEARNKTADKEEVFYRMRTSTGTTLDWDFFPFFKEQHRNQINIPIFQGFSTSTVLTFWSGRFFVVGGSPVHCVPTRCHKQPQTLSCDHH